MLRILFIVIFLLLGSPLFAEERENHKPIKFEEDITPIPSSVFLEKEKVELGRKLFHDTILSKNNAVSCASCHDLKTGGTNNTKLSTGMDGKQTKVNVPTVFNARFNFAQFWDGRAATLEDQIDGPILNHEEMGSTWQDVEQRLNSNKEYKKLFQEVYKNPASEKNIKDAISSFERSLVTPNSRFDKYLEGDENILSAEEKEGFRLFKTYGCISCHQGVNIGGNMYQTFGVMGDYFQDRGDINEADFGRYNATRNPADKYVFKVPSLRNVELTYPYFHDGDAETLEEAVEKMAKYQLGRKLSSDEIKAIVAFLKTLTGEMPQ